MHLLSDPLIHRLRFEDSASFGDSKRLCRETTSHSRNWFRTRIRRDTGRRISAPKFGFLASTYFVFLDRKYIHVYMRRAFQDKSSYWTNCHCSYATGETENAVNRREKSFILAGYCGEHRVKGVGISWIRQRTVRPVQSIVMTYRQSLFR